MSEDHHANDRGRGVRSPDEIREHINSDHPCCVPVGDAVGMLVELAALRAQVEDLKAGCVCQECGEHYREDVRLSDELWNRIRPKGKPEGAGLLCGGCIGRRLTEIVEEE